MKKLNVLAVTVAMLFTPAAFADDLGGVVETSDVVQADNAVGELTQKEIARAARVPTITASNSHGEPAAMTPSRSVMDSDYQVPPSNEGE